jgi:hypothetical protein
MASFLKTLHMQLHIVKLCVGADSIEDLAQWQASRTASARKTQSGPLLIHVTRQTPRRLTIGDNTSLYWVIRGFIQVRQRIIALHPVQSPDGIMRCAIELHPALIETVQQPLRPFQGWRYLKAQEAPSDVIKQAEDIGEDQRAMPPAMRKALHELRLV